MNTTVIQPPNVTGIKQQKSILNTPKVKKIIAPSTDITVSQKKKSKNKFKHPICWNNTPEAYDYSCKEILKTFFLKVAYRRHACTP